MPSQHDPSEPSDPYKSSEPSSDESGPVDPASPPIWWIFPGAIFCLFALSFVFGALSIPLGSAVAIPAIGGWIALLVWSVWVTASRRADTMSIYARSYLLANALVALVVGVVGTTCSGMGFGASSGSDGMGLVWILVCVLAISVGMFAFRWPRKS